MLGGWWMEWEDWGFRFVNDVQKWQCWKMRMGRRKVGERIGKDDERWNDLYCFFFNGFQFLEFEKCLSDTFRF